MYDPPLGAFLACVHSVRSQSFTDWEWCLVDDCSTRPEVLAALGVKLDVPPETMGACLDGIGIAFLFAPSLHPCRDCGAVAAL